jgi:hypothetical protein
VQEQHQRAACFAGDRAVQVHVAAINILVPDIRVQRDSPSASP